MLWRAISISASKPGASMSIVSGATVAISTTGSAVSSPEASARLRRSRSVTRPNRWPCSTSSTDETRWSRISSATARMGLCGETVIGVRLSSLRTGVRIRFMCGSAASLGVRCALGGSTKSCSAGCASSSAASSSAGRKPTSTAVSATAAQPPSAAAGCTPAPNQSGAFTLKAASPASLWKPTLPRATMPSRCVNASAPATISRAANRRGCSLASSASRAVASSWPSTRWRCRAEARASGSGKVAGMAVRVAANG